MNSNNIVDIKYCIKQNGKVIIITKEEYENFTKQLKEQGKKYICPDCSVCDCEKIRYTNINKAEEVDLALYERKIFESNNQGVIRKTKDIDFKVFECKRFTKYKERISQDDKLTAKEVIKIYKEMLELRSELNTYKNPETADRLLHLSYSKRDQYNSIKDKNIKNQLDKKLETIRKEYVTNAAKSLKMTLQK